MRILTTILGLVPMMASPQNVITPWWGTPFADGQFAPGEWTAAPTVDVSTGTGHFCTVAVACDAWGLYFGFMGYLETAFLFPELLIDAAHDRSADWEADDHWFHVSATACHHLAEYGVYDDCSPLPAFWSAHPLINPGSPSTDSIEVAIPWAMLGLSPMAGDTIGLAMVLTNTSTSWNNWPSGSAYWSPATWGHLVIPGATGVADERSTGPVRLWPNPAGEEVVLERSVDDQTAIDVLDAMGRVVLSRTGTGSRIALDVAGLAPGCYTVRVGSGADLRTCRLVRR